MTCTEASHPISRLTLPCLFLLEYPRNCIEANDSLVRCFEILGFFEATLSFECSIFRYRNICFSSVLGILDRTSLPQQVGQLALLCLQLGVATNVLLGDEDVGDGALAGDFLKGVLEGGTVVCGIVSLWPLFPNFFFNIPIWSSSRMLAFAPISLKSCLVALQ